MFNKWVIAFSAEKNMRMVYNVKRSPGEIPVLDGIRTLNTVLLVLAHMGVELNYSPRSNKAEMNDFIRGPITVPSRACYLNTDAFLMLSGFLTAYSLIGRLQKGLKINIVKEIAGRYFRIIPPMAAAMIFMTFIMPYIGSGPQWNMLITYQADLCKKTWWRNILMIQNWFGFENICLTNTHHLGTDFELFIVSIFLTIYLYKSPKNGTVLLFVLAAASTIGNFVMTYIKRVNSYVLYGVE